MSTKLLNPFSSPSSGINNEIHEVDSSFGPLYSAQTLRIMSGGGAILSLSALAVLLTGCSLFSTRDPETPLENSGSYIQPDTPEQVIENVQNAVSELNTFNYRRSLADEFVFRPTASALARESVFVSWSRAQEEQYFTALTAAAALNTGHGLQLNDQTLTLLGADEFVFDATYVLTINHRRAEVPTQVQGRMQWVIKQNADGLWALLDWTDQELGSEQSWSDLKAEFTK